MLLIALAGVAAMILMLAVLLSIDNVRDLFLDRFSLAENYDTGATGRFGRQAYAVDLALSNPWGIGPKEFTALRITEEPHNTYVNVILIYGWGGGLAFITMIGMTLWRAIRHLMIRSPHRLFLIALTATYIPLILEAGIIDIDHWRHFYLLTGLIWGVTTSLPRRRGRYKRWIQGTTGLPLGKHPGQADLETSAPQTLAPLLHMSGRRAQGRGKFAS